LQEVHHPDEPMPPITQFIEKGEAAQSALTEIPIFDITTLAENGDDSDSGDDVEMGGVTQNFLCPLTLTPLTNPLTSLVFNVLCVLWVTR
jgi:E3 SUMO-protein ligase NSE2